MKSLYDAILQTKVTGSQYSKNKDGGKAKVTLSQENGTQMTLTFYMCITLKDTG
jgi:hypothetical protein